MDNRVTEDHLLPSYMIGRPKSEILTPAFLSLANSSVGRPSLNVPYIFFALLLSRHFFMLHINTSCPDSEPKPQDLVIFISLEGKQRIPQPVWEREVEGGKGKQAACQRQALRARTLQKAAEASRQREFPDDAKCRESRGVAKPAAQRCPLVPRACDDQASALQLAGLAARLAGGQQQQQRQEGFALFPRPAGDSSVPRRSACC